MIREIFEGVLVLIAGVMVLVILFFAIIGVVAFLSQFEDEEEGTDIH